MSHLYPYKPGSNSARALADVLGLRIIKHENSKFKGSPNKKVINWGSSELPPEVNKSTVINKLGPVRIAGNKLLCLKALDNSGVSVPRFTESRDQAIKWLEEDRTVVAREVLNGHSGRGIKILEKGLDFVEAPCYTVYIPKIAEYRVHVVAGQIIDIQRKVKDPNRDVRDWKVRSHDNGFMFVRNNDQGRPYKEVAERNVREQALAAVATIGLDFGAVDVIFNGKYGRAYVLEINCAPGLEGESINNYANAFKRFFA